MNKGRLHVELYELKDEFKARCAHGDMTGYTRYLIQCFLENRIMILDKEVLEVIDRGDFDEAVNLILPGLSQLREARLRSGQVQKAVRKKAAVRKGKASAGVKSDEQRKAEAFFDKMTKGE